MQLDAGEEMPASLAGEGSVARIDATMSSEDPSGCGQRKQGGTVSAEKACNA